jgi:kynureninase
MSAAASGRSLPRLDAFHLPRGVYLEGNSLGVLPTAAQAAIERRLRQWQVHGVSAWDDWFGLAERLSASLGALVGAHPDEVIATGSITTNLHQLLATLHRPDATSRDALATELDFPTDLYALRSWTERGGGSLRLVPSRDGHTIDPADIETELRSGGVATMLLPVVAYRSGQRFDVGRLTAAAHAVGALALWDAAHSIGVMPHTLHDDGVDGAVWCSYKYLNAGPGAPGGLFLHRRHAHCAPGLPGWWGHDKATQFEMAPTYTPAAGAARLQTGTPPILSLAGLEGALAVFEEVGIAPLRERSLALTDALWSLLEAQVPEVRIVTPWAHPVRGGHLALSHRHAAGIVGALRRRGVITDFRPPDLVRMAPAPLYTRFEDVGLAVTALRESLDAGDLQEPPPTPVT